MNEEINKYRIFNKLKSVYRSTSVDKRKESSAEHSWGCLILADFFLAKIDKKKKIDRLRVYELLMYHDVVEIEAGDTPILLDVPSAEKKKLEFNSAKELVKKLPESLSNRYWALFSEFEEGESTEARFAKAIDAMEAEIHELDYKDDWKCWSKDFLVSKKSHLFDEFPAMKETFDELLDFLTKENYF